MPDRPQPPFRAEHVGSFLRPAELLTARERRAAGSMSPAELRCAEDRAIADIVGVQEELGFGAVTDGEFRRAWFHLEFLQGFDNVEVVRSPLPARFRTSAGELEMHPPALRLRGKLGHSRQIFVEDFTYLKSVAKAVAKITLPSPSLMHFRGGRATVGEDVYPDLAEFYDDIARVYAAEIADLGAAGCTYIQLDEICLAYLCDPAMADKVRSIGEDPATLPATYADLINRAIGGRPAGMTVGMHLCRGNFRSGWVAEGGYEPIADMLFNRIGVDTYFLEYDTARAGNFEPLRFVPKGKTVVLGLVSSKEPALESRDELKRRIEEASRFIALDQLALSPQCGFASTVEGNAVSHRDQLAKLRLVVDTANEVWR
jgi:5-methyltetrahydropteroyltriglutamate--homocysteine methyltransferase